MDQHPIPQHVTGYQFRLVGDMTLKQFAELASGIVLAILASKANFIPFFIKWPLAGLFAFGGVALAFLPVEERPLDKWLVNFIKAIYSPTQYLWHKRAIIPDFLSFEKGKTSQEKITPVRPKDKKQLQAFMQTLTSQTPLSPVDQQEEKSLIYINNLFGSSPAPTSQPTISFQPAGLKPRKLKPKKDLVKEEIIFKQKLAEKTATPYEKLPQPETPQPPTISEVEKKPPQPTTKIVAAQPLAPPLKVTSLYPPKPPPPKKKRPKKRKVGPQFADDLPMPVPPDLPNLLVGMVVGPDDRLVSNAILEIKDLKENPVRALKTNKLGQFFIATSLPNGDYEIETDHPDYHFDIIKISAEGKIIPPIKIKAVKEIKQKTKNQK